jgi:hypothetical protein
VLQVSLRNSLDVWQCGAASKSSKVAKQSRNTASVVLHCILSDLDVGFPLDISQQCATTQNHPAQCVFVCGAVIGYQNRYHRPLESSAEHAEGGILMLSGAAPSESYMKYKQHRRRLPTKAATNLDQTNLLASIANEHYFQAAKGAHSLLHGSFIRLVGRSAFLVQRI